jgi:hypothetical protein
MRPPARESGVLPRQYGSTERTGPVTVDFRRFIARCTLDRSTPIHALKYALIGLINGSGRHNRLHIAWSSYLTSRIRAAGHHSL